MCVCIIDKEVITSNYKFYNLFFCSDHLEVLCGTKKGFHLPQGEVAGHRQNPVNNILKVKFLIDHFCHVQVCTSQDIYTKIYNLFLN